MNGSLRALPSPRVSELARLAGGQEADICAHEWSRTLEELFLTSLGFCRSRRFLTNQPVEESIEVFVDETFVPRAPVPGQVLQWSYDFSTNSISFANLVEPPPGSEILVRYDADDCPPR
ncbi:MAG: hypothetical protein AAF851_07890 [Myxococcota bacterium]